MTDKKIKIADASEEQLRHFIEVRLGVPTLPAKATRAKLTAIIEALYDGNTIEVEEKAAPAKRPTEHPAPAKARDAAKRRMVIESSKDDPTVELIIAQGQGEGDARDVPVAVNGKCMLIPRGKKVEIPYRFFLALNEAIALDTTQLADGTLQVTEHHCYPFSVTRMPTEEAIYEWHEACVRADKTQRKEAA